ncbi:MAG: TetR/AcrR family transcriptional regulator [Burkholderiales bacterium]|nr:TetR/AcrR family transcriptional regulator [Burkholderiales bacterium]
MNNQASPVKTDAPPRRRLAPQEREHDIVQKAVTVFARQGFQVSTRDLAKALGITQPLLYRYFPSKEVLIDRVYDEVFSSRWNPEWEEWLADRTHPLRERLCHYLKDYAKFVLRNEWVRIFIYAGLTRGGINQKYLNRLRERHFAVIARELRHSYGIPEPRGAADEEDEIELVWSMHSGVFYFGVRKWIYEESIPRNIDHHIELRVDAFLEGAPNVLRNQRKTPGT